MVALMSDNERTLWDQRKDTREAYRKGIREGWDQARWAGIGVCVILYFVVSYFPD